MNGLVTGLAGLSGLAEGVIWHAALVFLRVGAAVFLLPALGEMALPQRVRLAAAVVITLVVAPAVPATGATGLPAFLAEAAAGLALGMGLRFFILGIQTAGTIAAQSTSLAQMFSGTGPEPQPTIASLLTLGGLALFVGMGGLERSAQLLLQSYALVPAGRMLSPGDLAQWGVARVAQVFALAFALAAPFLIAALLYNLTLGVINRAMPMLMVALIGAPALTLGGLALLALAAPLMLGLWRDALGAALARGPGG